MLSLFPFPLSFIYNISAFSSVAPEITTPEEPTIITTDGMSDANVS